MDKESYEAKWSIDHDGIAEVAVRKADEDDTEIGIPSCEYLGIAIVALLAAGQALTTIMDESDLKDEMKRLLDRQADIWYYG